MAPETACRALLLLVLSVTAEAKCGPGEDGAATCDVNITSTGSYYWPMAMGHPLYYSNPPWPGPPDLKSTFSWSWFGPRGRYLESFTAGVIDDKKDIYVNGDKSVYKLSPDGTLLWTSSLPSRTSADGPALYQGNVHVNCQGGEVVAIDMQSGKLVWSVKAHTYAGGEYGHLGAHNGVLVVDGDMTCQEYPWPSCSAKTVRGLNTTTGQTLWAYEPGDILWDWFPQFPDDHSVIMMTQTGSVFDLELHTGKLIWKSDGIANTWTDGSQFVASNGLTYGVQVNDHSPKKHIEPGWVVSSPGFITAYRTSDGSKVWTADVPKPPNSSPVVGRLGKTDKLSMVIGIGQQSQRGCGPPAAWIYESLSFLPDIVRGHIFGAFHALSIWLGEENGRLWGTQTRVHDVYAFDAATGQPQWVWNGPMTRRPMNNGDEQGWLPRFHNNLRTVCCPTPWGQPRIDSEGAIFIGHENGGLYKLHDKNGDDHIDDETEVEMFQTLATFPHPGTAHAPGLMVAVNFDGVFAWRY